MTQIGGIKATAIAVPAKLPEIFGSTLAYPLIPPAATAIPKSNSVGFPLANTSLPKLEMPTSKPRQ